MTSTPAASPALPKPRTWAPPIKHPLLTAGIVIVAIVGAGVILSAWNIAPFGAQSVSTQDAYVRGHVTSIAPQVSGYVTEVLVKDYQTVKAGQVLVRIDDRIYTQRLAAAQASLAAAQAALANSTQAQASRVAASTGQSAAVENAKAQLVKAEADMKRADDLVSDGSISVRERDQTVAALQLAQAQLSQAEAGSQVSQVDIRTVVVGRDGLRAQVAAAQAQVHLAEIDLNNCTIVAPQAGQVGEVGVRLGQYVTNGNQLLSLVPPERWVLANFKEAQTGRMAVGDPVTFTVDGLNQAKFHGHIERISPATGSEFSVIKADNGTGNFVKIPQRIGVHVDIDPNQALASRLRPGMSVEVRAETRTTQ